MVTEDLPPRPRRLLTAGLHAMPAEERLERLDDLTERGRLAAGRPLLPALA